MRVFTNGTFDVLHIGHVRLLEFCRRAAGPTGRVIVGLNSDSSVTSLKGLGRPINREEHRVEFLRSLRCVDDVIVFEEDTPYNLISSIQPDLIVKGGDYCPEDVVGSDLVPVEIFDRVEDLSSTEILRRLG